jgi:hypothetical protein
MKHAALTAAILATLTFATGPAFAKGASFVDNDKVLTHDCAKDPAVSVLGNKNKITITGTCKRIDVAGDDNTLIVASVTNVSISGNKNTLTIEAVDQINAAGNENTVTWKKGVAGPKAKVSTLGSKNSVTQAK